MIKIGETFTARRTERGWTLEELRPGFDKNNVPKAHTDITYHANIVQVCDAVLNKMGGDCETAEQIKNLYFSAKSILVEKMEATPDEECEYHDAGFCKAKDGIYQ